MFIQGFINASATIRSYLMSEYAFSIFYKNRKELRIGHHKGEWYVGRFIDGEFRNIFSLYDNCDVSPDGEEFIIKIVESICKLVSESYKGICKGPRWC